MVALKAAVTLNSHFPPLYVLRNARAFGQTVERGNSHSLISESRCLFSARLKTLDIFGPKMNFRAVEERLGRHHHLIPAQ